MGCKVRHLAGCAARWRAGSGRRGARGIFRDELRERQQPDTGPRILPQRYFRRIIQAEHDQFVGTRMSREGTK